MKTLLKKASAKVCATLILAATLCVVFPVAMTGCSVNTSTNNEEQREHSPSDFVYLDKHVFEIDGTEISLPCKFSDFEKQGWKLNKKETEKFTEKPLKDGEWSTLILTNSKYPDLDPAPFKVKVTGEGSNLSAWDVYFVTYWRTEDKKGKINQPKVLFNGVEIGGDADQLYKKLGQPVEYLGGPIEGNAAFGYDYENTMFQTTDGKIDLIECNVGDVFGISSEEAFS